MAEIHYIKCIVDTTQNANSKFVEYGDPTSYNGSAQCQKAAWEIMEAPTSATVISQMTMEELNAGLSPLVMILIGAWCAGVVLNLLWKTPTR